MKVKIKAKVTKSDYHFGPMSDIEGKILHLIERNPTMGGCLCEVPGKGLLDVHKDDVEDVFEDRAPMKQQELRHQVQNIFSKPAAASAFMAGDVENAKVAMTPGGIEAQERDGQNSFVNSDELPVDAPWDDLKKMGIKPVEHPKHAKLGGELFVKVELPKGWEKRPTDHDMWNELVDDTGKVRATIFYKAAFYDQRAFLRLA